MLTAIVAECAITPDQFIALAAHGQDIVRRALQNGEQDIGVGHGEDCLEQGRENAVILPCWSLVG